MKKCSEFKSDGKKSLTSGKNNIGNYSGTSAKESTTMHNEDTKSLPAAFKEKILNALSDIKEEKLLEFLSTSFNFEEIRQDVFKVIHRETIYIARIPKKFDAERNQGILDFMIDSKTGENLGVLVSKKHKIRGFVQIEEIVKTDIAENISNIAMHQKLALITEVINDVRSRVIALQEGHDSDLFGSIKGMHQQLLQIKDARNPDTRKQLTANAITVLNEVRGKAEAAIINELKNISDMPHTDIGIMGKILRDKNFLSDTIMRYDRIEELFSYYLTATQLLGYAYAFLDEPQSYEDIFAPNQELIANPNLHKLFLIENLYEEAIGETWYKNPERFLLEIKEKSHSLFQEDSDTIEIEITGKELLEVIENGGT